MWQESAEQPVALRSGLTTGSCATACCVAACRYLFTGQHADKVEITLPRGKTVEMTLCELTSLPGSDSARAVRVATVKDAGDDPDATHGATVFVELHLHPEPGIHFRAGEGVGTVTKTGLLLEIGEPAINPVPRKMMTEHLARAAQCYQYSGGFEVVVGVENGEQIALKTMNGRLGIVGGLSILGTTGIVRPFSCAAYIASIRQGVDVALSNGCTHIAASTGSSSEQRIARHYDLAPMALIEMGDFVGALLKHVRQLVRHGCALEQLTICGGFGKISKLAQGAMDLNSRSSAIDFAFLARCIDQLHCDEHAAGASQALLRQVHEANTSIAVLSLAREQQLPLAEYLCQLALQQVEQVIGSAVKLEVFAIDRHGEFVACAGGER